jgi:DNA-binding transcriptional ArsR family regulator
MQEGPNIARIAAVIGERARAQILTALMSGRALTATELADVANVSRPTVSSHLTQLQRARLVSARNAGRHRYFEIANAEVAQMIEPSWAARKTSWMRSDLDLAIPRFAVRDSAMTI